MSTSFKKFIRWLPWAILVLGAIVTAYILDIPNSCSGEMGLLCYPAYLMFFGFYVALPLGTIVSVIRFVMLIKKGFLKHLTEITTIVLFWIVVIYIVIKYGSVIKEWFL